MPMYVESYKEAWRLLMKFGVPPQKIEAALTQFEKEGETRIPFIADEVGVRDAGKL